MSIKVAIFFNQQMIDKFHDILQRAIDKISILTQPTKEICDFYSRLIEECFTQFIDKVHDFRQ